MAWRELPAVRTYFAIYSEDRRWEDDGEEGWIRWTRFGNYELTEEPGEALLFQTAEEAFIFIGHLDLKNSTVHQLDIRVNRPVAKK